MFQVALQSIKQDLINRTSWRGVILVLSRISSTAKTVRTICRGEVKHFYIDFFPFIYENEEKADAITIFFLLREV